MAWRNRMEVSYGALRHNVQAIRAWIGDRHLIAVIKADAYGLGLERCARIYHEAGTDVLAVASWREADRVRKILPAARVMLLGSPLPEEREVVATSGFEVWCSTLLEVNEYAGLARTYPGLGLHVCVDTGMGRAGCRPEEALALVRAVLASADLRLAGICTHYPLASDAAFSDGQDRVFREILASLPPLPPHCLIHVANSEGLLLRRDSPGNAVRSGLLLTGVLPRGCPDPGLRPALRWVSSLSLVKDLPVGHNISYNLTCHLTRPSTVGLVPVGYADGYPLGLSSRGQVLVHGRRCPILGRVTMDYHIVDLTGLDPRPAVGDPVILLGTQGGESIDVNELADWARTIPYDILCGIRGRCEVVGVH
jgi:alanine racemase